MAAKRISPGVYEVNGKRVNASSPQEAIRKAGGGGAANSSKSKTNSNSGGGSNASGETSQPARVKLDKSERKVLKDVRGGKAINNILGFDRPLSRVSTDIPEDQRAYIESVRALSDPSSAAFVGRRSEEEKGAIERLRSLMNEAGQRTPEEQRALAALEEVLGRAGARSGEMSDLLSQMKSRAATAGQRSEEMKETLALMKQGLAGLNASENQALREQAQREVDRKYKEAVEQLQNASRMSGMGSATRAGMRNARRDAMSAQADMEQKNLLANIDVQDKRRGQYADTLTATEAAEDLRGRLALDAYRNQLSDTESEEFRQRADASRNYASGVNDFTANRFNRMNTAANNYANNVGQYGQNERERVRNAMADYGDAIRGRNDFFMDATKINLGQERTERAAEVQGALGFAGQAETERARRRALRQNKRRGGDGRIAGGEQQQGQYGGFNNPRDQEYYETVRSIYEGNR